MNIMRKLFFISIFLAFASAVGVAQNFSKLESIPLKDSVDCKNAEPKVLECANYLLSTPCVEDRNSLLAIQFIFEWMSNTKDYTFSIDKLFLSVSKADKSKNLMHRFLASMAKTAITENPESCKDEEFIVKYLTVFAGYCENPKYKVPKSSFIKKLVKAKNDNTLAEFIRKESK